MNIAPLRWTPASFMFHPFLLDRIMDTLPSDTGESEDRVMNNAYIVTGTLLDARTVTLDEALPLTPTKVRLVVEPLSSVSRQSHQEVVAALRTRQQARGHSPPTREEVDRYLQAERESWGK
ncbi:MAG: hypothetical protein ACRERD_26975 [Candidatus Binatia bacterium]